MDAYLVEYYSYGNLQKFITLDRTRADDYAIRHNGVIYGLVKCLETEDKSKMSLPLSMTEPDACCQPAATVM